jgi:hypothetical protein
LPSKVQLQVEFDEADWNSGDTWVADGVLAGDVSLRLDGRVVLDGHICGLNNSAISLLQSALGSHHAATETTSFDAEWPLFMCAGHLRNECGVVVDFSITRESDRTVFSDFYGCELPADAVVTVPSRDWTSAVARLGRDVLQRCPPNKTGIKAEAMPLYESFRAQLRSTLDRAEAELRAGDV